MKGIRAIICDVYGTILELGPPPADADARWARLCRDALGIGRAPALEIVSARCREIVARDHAAARAQGIAFPEVSWPGVMERALPELCDLAGTAREDFVPAHIQLLRSTRLMRGAAEFLVAARARGIALGIASNAQAYTLRELDAALAGSEFGIADFERELSVWSFENGFSKPDPRVFEMLGARLARRGIHAPEILMIGDRRDNDIEPAEALGWRTWRLAGETDWPALQARMG
jgi:FMN phosphatase YigB (HAD superfamily)